MFEICIMLQNSHPTVFYLHGILYLVIEERIILEHTAILNDTCVILFTMAT